MMITTLAIIDRFLPEEYGQVVVDFDCSEMFGGDCFKKRVAVLMITTTSVIQKPRKEDLILSRRHVLSRWKSLGDF